jgi:Ca2+-binding EF-hand superfamily protein
MSKLTKLIIAGFSVSLFIGGVVAKDKKAPETPESTLEKLDTDKDSKLSAEEYSASGKDQKAKDKLTKAFKKLDTDKDSFLT